MSSFGQDPTIFSWFPPDELSFVWQVSNRTNRTLPQTAVNQPNLNPPLDYSESKEQSIAFREPSFKFTVMLEQTDMMDEDPKEEDKSLLEDGPSFTLTSDEEDIDAPVPSGDFSTDNADCTPDDLPNGLENIKLTPSKSPIMDALVYCALNNWGIRLVREEGDDIQFEVTNFSQYYTISARICSKQNPTEDQSSRIKSLKRWFPDFPSKRENGYIKETFTISVAKRTRKDNKPKKLQEIIERNRQALLKVQKENMTVIKPSW